MPLAASCCSTAAEIEPAAPAVGDAHHFDARGAEQLAAAACGESDAITQTGVSARAR